jgi:hypothetical protein
MMTINFPMLLYRPVFEQFARPVTFHPIVSQPGAPSFEGRAIYDTEEIDIETLDGALFSETRTQLDILEIDFSTLPLQGDLVVIAGDENVRGGSFVISDMSPSGNAGGEVSLQLRRISVPKLVGGSLVLAAPTFGRPRLQIQT